MKRIAEILDALDSASRGRVVKWLIERSAAIVGHVAVSTHSSQANIPERPKREIAGIAKLNDAGDVVLTVRDFKAKSAVDAALRIAHVAILASQELKREEFVSSKKVVVPALKRYRAYAGSTRGAIANHRGIIRQGDLVSLDAFSVEEARRYVKEILDEKIQGSWNPTTARSDKKKAASPVQTQPQGKTSTA